MIGILAQPDTNSSPYPQIIITLISIYFGRLLLWRHAARAGGRGRGGRTRPTRRVAEKQQASKAPAFEWRGDVESNSPSTQ